MVIFIAAFKTVGWSFADVNTQLSAIDPNLVQPFNESGLYSLSGVIAMPFYLFVSLVANPYCTIRLMAMTNVAVGLFASMMACVDSMIHCISAMLSVDIYKKRTLATAVLAVIVTVAVSLFTKPVDPAVLNRMKGLKAVG